MRENKRLHESLLETPLRYFEDLFGEPRSFYSYLMDELAPDRVAQTTGLPFTPVLGRPVVYEDMRGNNVAALDFYPQLRERPGYRSFDSYKFGKYLDLVEIPLYYLTIPLIGFGRGECSPLHVHAHVVGMAKELQSRGFKQIKRSEKSLHPVTSIFHSFMLDGFIVERDYQIDANTTFAVGTKATLSEDFCKWCLMLAFYIRVDGYGCFVYQSPSLFADGVWSTKSIHEGSAANGHHLVKQPKTFKFLSVVPIHNLAPFDYDLYPWEDLLPKVKLFDYSSVS